jgi:hypothetical protein
MDERAKCAYRIYAATLLLNEPWEHLSNAEQLAWCQIVDNIEPEEPVFDDDLPECDCGTELACPVCDIEKFAVVAATAGQPTAVLTQKV